MKINAQLYKIDGGLIDEKEAICNPAEAEKAIEEMTAWFKEQLTDAFKQGEDVEILLGRKPNNGSANFTI